MTAVAEQLILGDLVVPDVNPSASIEERFLAFHSANPWVYAALERLAEQAWFAGRRKVGMKAMYEVLRWQHAQRTAGDVFRLNNNFTSRFGRMLLDAHPEWADAGFIETRQLKAA